VTPRPALVVLITGAPGAGKSSVAGALHDLLAGEGVANAVVEADELRRAHPPLAPERVRRHLGSLATAYAGAGYALLIVTETLETAQDARATLAALGGGDVLLVRLDAGAATVAARIRAREPAWWAGLDRLVAHAERLTDDMRSLPGVDLVLSTEGRTARSVAREVLAAVRAQAG